MLDRFPSAIETAPVRAIVVGGGIGGVTAALAMAQSGLEVVVLEQAHELREIGAGLQMASNGTRVMEHLGLRDELAAVAVAADGIEFADFESGELIFRTPLGPRAADRYGATFFQVHRSDLLDILVRAVPEGTVRLGQQVVGVAQGPDAASVRLASGEELEADVVVGADGIHSRVRELLFGPSELNSTGLAAWRALIPAERMAAAGVGHICAAWMGRGRSSVCYWVRPGELFNFVGIVPATEARPESWTEQGSVAALQASFVGCNPTLRSIVDAVDTAFVTSFHDRNPLPSWTQGRVTLLGDAAHPMQPFLAQGACQAMEDAVALAGCVARHGRSGAAAALAEYEQRRRPRATRTQVVAAASEATWHATDEALIRARNGRFRGIARVDPLTESVWGWLYHHDPVAAAAAPLEDVVGLSAARLGRVRTRDEAHRAHELWASMLAPADVARGVPGLRDAYERLLARFPVPEGTSVEAVEVGGVPCRRVLAAGADPHGPLVLHLHGGGYVVGSAEGSVELAARLSAAAGGPVLVPDYRLAPEHPFPAALDDVETVYRALVGAADGAAADGDTPVGGPVALSGESAGGGLAVALAVRARDRGLARPGLVFALSPFADLSVTGASVAEEAGRDPVANRDLLVTMSASYLQGHDPADPEASPVHADLAGLPPMLVAYSRTESLRSDAEALVAAALRDGVEVDVVACEDTVHVYAVFPFLPESDELLDRFGASVRQVAAPVDS